MGLARIHLAGHSFGGWLAAEMAKACLQLVNRLVFVDSAGIEPEVGEILDIFILTPEDILVKAFYKPEQVPEWNRLYGSPPWPSPSYMWYCIQDAPRHPVSMRDGRVGQQSGLPPLPTLRDLCRLLCLVTDSLDRPSNIP